MNLSLQQLIEILLAAAWRRRRLIIVPILLFSVLSVITTAIWPRTYATRTLLMLQERQVSDPLSSGASGGRESRLKAEEIDTLLKSERVLANAVLDMSAGKTPMTARDIEGAIKSLRRQIGVSVVGSDFIEIELKQSDRVGLGERLSIIMTHFFERLLSREDSMKTARQFALEQRRRDLEASRISIDDWLRRAAAASSTVAGMEDKTTELQTRRAAFEQKLLATAGSVLAEPTTIATLGESIAEEIRHASIRVRGPQGAVQAPPPNLAALKDLEVQFENYQSLSADLAKAVIARGREAAQSLQKQDGGQAAANTSLKEEWQRLDARFTESLAQFDAHLKRSKKATAPTLTPFGLVAPDSIRIVDEPRDPTTPTTSLLKIVVACLAAGVGLGVGLAAIFEQLDDRLYDSRELGRMVGVDSVFHISKLDAGSLVGSEQQDRPARRRSHLAVVSEA